MAILPVVQYPDPVLLKPVEPIKEIGPAQEVLVHDLIDTMYDAGGVGLSANQIGVCVRAFVCSPDLERGKEQVYFNPVIIKKSGRVCDLEGCLSVRGITENVTRSRKVTMRAQNIKGEKIEVSADGLLSRIFQHEIDHLDGKVFMDRLGWLKKRRALKAFSVQNAPL